MRKTYLVVLGSLIIVVGLAMLPLPGPGSVVILGGFAVMASAGVLWAARLLVRTRERLPDPADEPVQPNLFRRAIIRIDRHMERIEAVEVVREQDRVTREERFQEDLVITLDDEHPGEPVEEALATEVSLPPEHRIM